MISGKKVKEKLKELRMTQTQLAKNANVERYQISQLCKDKRKDFFFSTIKRIAKALNSSIDELFGDSNENEN
jgi:transcriptional regulator with XRE-family HTH domain